jgi:hypothetical protein
MKIVIEPADGRQHTRFRRFTMSDEGLELLITLDDPVDTPEEDIFNHLQATNLEYWLSQRFLDHRSRMDFSRTSGGSQ